MAYGSNIAGSFRLQSQNNPGGNIIGSLNPQDVIQRGLQAEQELIGSQTASVPEPPQDLQFVQGTTEEVYKKWAELKNYVSTMWNNYRIDVQRPDLRDESSIRAAQSYQKGLADIRYSIDLLKNSEKQKQGYDKAVIDGKGNYLVDPTKTILANQNPEDVFYNTEGLDKLNQASNYAYAKSYDTMSAKKQAQQGVAKNKEYYAQLKSRLPQIAEALADKEAGLQGPVYEQPQFSPNSGGSGNDSNAPGVVVNELSYIRKLMFNNDPGSIAYLKSKGIEDVQRTVNGAKVVANGKTYQIDFKSPYGGLDVINEFRNDGLPTKEKIPTRNLLPYFAMGKEGGVDQLPEDPSFHQLDRMKYITENMYKEGAKDVDEKQRKYVLSKLQSAVDNGQLLTIDGRKVDEIGMEATGGGWFTPDENPVVTLTIYGSGNQPDKQVVYDLSNPVDQAEYKKFLDTNAGALVDWNMINKTEIETPKEFPGDGSLIKPKMTKEQFKALMEKQYPSKSGSKFDVEAFKKKNAKK